MKYAIFTFIVLFSVSCLETESTGGSSSKRSYNEPYSPASPITYDAEVQAKQKIPLSFDGTSLLPAADFTGYTFTLSNAPSWLSINSSTGELTGTPGNGDLGLSSGVQINAIGATSYNVQFKVAVNGDPLRRYAWHLDNTGQRNFSYYNGSGSLSINADAVYARGITGKGVRVAVSDSGVEINHDDLYQNSLAGEHKDYTLSPPYYGTPTAAHFHGTAVTSLISGKGWNNEGSMGVAPDSNFAGLQFLNSSQSPAILINQASGDFNIFNYSYGDYLNRDTQSDSSYLDQIRYMTRNGSFFVKSAGNEFYGYGAEGCFSHNANAPFENESPYLIVVGAVNADDERSTYSSAGSNIWVSAPGGENGRSDGPAIMAADLPTCFKGTSKATSAPWNEFEYGHSLNSKCNYTSTMNGTSSAAPIVSGVIALVLEQNPSLSWREVKHILAVTAQKIDSAGNGSWPYLDHPSKRLFECDDYSHPDSTYEYEQGWVTNTAGYSFHNYYGFGLVDADAAVTMAAAGYSMPDLIETNPDFNVAVYANNTDYAIPDATKTGATSTISVGALNGLNSDFVVESVQVRVQVSHALSGEVGIELVSPTGTKSIMLNINNSFLDCDRDNCHYDSNLDITLASHAFYGEIGIGDWTLRAVDGSSGTSGTLLGWQLNLLGHNP